jgi:hypothetical protein
MTDSLVISDKYREQIRAQRKADGIVLRTPKCWLSLSGAEAERLAAFIRNEPHIQRYPVMAPESPQAHEQPCRR